MIPGLGFGTYSPALRSYGLTQGGIADSIERLATGQRLNRASDDPSGMQAVTRFDADAAVLEGEIERLRRENHWLAALEGGYTALADLVQGLHGPIVTAANTGASSDVEREALQGEIDGILTGLEHVLNTQKFNGQSLFKFTLAGLGSVDAADAGTDGDPDAAARFSLLDLRSGGALAVDENPERLGKAQELVESLVRGLGAKRAGIGSEMRANDRTISAKSLELEAITGMRSEIEDTDFAAETANLVRNQILQQAQLASMQIGNQNAGAVLALIDSATPVKGVAGAF